MRWFLVMTLGFTTFAYAQPENPNTRDPRLQEGKFFSVSLSPKDNKVVVSLSGRPLEKLGPDRVSLLCTEVSTNGKTRKLTVRPSGLDFRITEPMDHRHAYKIEVQDRKDSKAKESFTFPGPR